MMSTACNVFVRSRVTQGYSNESEARIVAEQTRMAVQRHGASAEIIVMTFYNMQRKKLEEEWENHPDLQHVRIASVRTCVQKKETVKAHSSPHQNSISKPLDTRSRCPVKPFPDSSSNMPLFGGNPCRSSMGSTVSCFAAFKVSIEKVGPAKGDMILDFLTGQPISEPSLYGITNPETLTRRERDP